jgi:putative Mn2+ efflux pump MntP
MGLQWGVGHSTGLLVVGGILIGISSGNDSIEFPHALTVVLESLVGVFMVALGMYGMYKAMRKHRQRIEASDDVAETEKQDSDVGEEEVEDMFLTSVGDNAAVANEGVVVVVDEELALSQAYPANDVDEQLERELALNSNEQILEYEPGTSNVEGNDESEDADMVDEEDNLSRMQKCRLLFRKWSTACLALCAGLVHGLVGPGGVLGVIPAVQIRDPALGALYLGTFCIASTLTMGTFAVLYGGLTATFAKVTSHRFEYRIEMASAILSIVVGILWLVLVATGKMEDVFE